MCEHTLNKSIVAMNVFGLIIKSEGNYYLTTLNCQEANLWNLIKHYPSLFPLLGDLPFKKMSLEVVLDNKQHIMLRINQLVEVNNNEKGN